jgi:septal ring factor EnvC (AmiA/AmiB activator)
MRASLLLGLLLTGAALAQAPLTVSGPPMVGGAPLGSMPVDEPGLLAQIQLLDAELALVEGQHLSLEEHVLALESGRQQHLLALADIDDRLLYQRQTLGRQLAAVYKASRRGLARMIFGAESPDDLRRVVVYELAIIRGLNRRVRDFQATQLQRKDALAALDRDSVALGNQRAELQLRGAELKDQRSRRLELLLEIRSRRDLTSQLAGEWQQAQRSFGDTIRPLPPPPSTVGLNAGPVGSGSSMSLTVSEPERSAASAEASCPDFRERHGRLAWPASGAVVARYGDPMAGGGAVRKGIAVAAALGTPVRSVCGGVVKLAAYVPGYGQTVAVEHGAYTTVYSHMNGIKARKGDGVAAGEVVGFVGNTGLTEGTGHQLGFELRYNGTPQDPLPWLGSP